MQGPSLDGRFSFLWKDITATETSTDAYCDRAVPPSRAGGAILSAEEGELCILFIGRRPERLLPALFRGHSWFEQVDAEWRGGWFWDEHARQAEDWNRFHFGFRLYDR
jgi:hypothetical protein